MKDLLKLGFSLALLFVCLFIAMRLAGVLPEDEVRAWEEGRTPVPAGVWTRLTKLASEVFGPQAAAVA